METYNNIFSRQSGPDQFKQNPESLKYAVGCDGIRGSQVIITAIYNHLFGMIGNYDIVGITDHIRQCGSAEAPVDDGISRKIIADVCPFGKG